MVFKSFEKRESPEADLIFLVGFMGAGKTTVGRALAEKLGYEFIDIDDVIESQSGRSVKAIFDESGEVEFRRLERAALASCRDLKRTVIALGGGAYVSKENRAILRQMGKTVWLDCPLKICLTRIAGNKSRPLLSSESEMAALLDSRRLAYALADYRIETGTRPPKCVAQSILEVLGLSD